jgi:hypothetical protein
MPINKEIRIIKVPLSSKERLPDYPQAFPRMPRLYLELLENKAKIKQDLINKEHVPSNMVPQFPGHEQREKYTDHREHRDNDDRREHDRRDHRDHREYDRRDEHRYDDLSDTPPQNDNQRISDEREINEKYSINSLSTPEVSSRSEVLSPRSIISDISKHSSGYEIQEESDRASVASSNDLSVRLKELLGETDDERSPESYKADSRSVESVGDKYSRHHKSPFVARSAHVSPYEKYRAHRQAQEGAKVAPPTLAELQAQGKFQAKTELRDINHMGISEQDSEDKKREILFKFDLLKKSYPGASTTIPEFTIHSDLGQMQKSYDSTVRRLSLDSTVEGYKQYLIGGFMLVEFVFGNFLGFDMQGFTQQQIISMHSYERLLIELGEKSYVPSGSKWPVELRLLFLIIINAGFFIVSKMIMRKTGANLMNMVNNMNASSRATQQPAARPKRRMRGPTINLDDIPDGDEVTGDDVTNAQDEAHRNANRGHQHSHQHA